MGSRMIPTTVGYRGDEVLVGQAASAQEHKNSANTFADVRGRMMGCGEGSVPMQHVPVLDKEIPVTELSKHFFRNIHNQVKQQMGKIVRECVLTVPSGISDADRTRLKEVAQEGGIRVKAMVPDTTAVLMAYGMDNADVYGRVCVVDMGWGHTEVAVMDVKAGVIFPKGSTTIEAINGKTMVEAITKHCVKDFMRRTKNDCSDSKKSMLRLRKESEQALKQLSMGTEVTIDIDALFDGVDYSGRLTRARCDDLVSIPFMMMKKTIEEFLSSAGIDRESVTHVCMAGGLAAMPKSIATAKALFPKSIMAKPNRGPSASGMNTTAEAQCAGAAMRGRELVLEGRLNDEDLEEVATASLPSLGRCLALTADGEGDAGEVRCEMLPVGTPLPVSRSIVAPVTAEHNVFRLVAGGGAEALVTGDDTPLAEVGFSVPGATTEVPVGVKVTVDVTTSGDTTVSVTKQDVELTSITVPASA